MQSLTLGRKLDSYTGVIIHAGQSSDGSEIEYSAGNSAGYVLELDNPLGTQAMAQMILDGLKLRGIRYQPFEAGSAILDPSAELGDNVSVNGVSSILFRKLTRHTHLMAADAAAPHDEEVDHEFSFVPRTVREFRRESAYTRSRIALTAEQIQLEVTRATATEGNLSSLITQNAESIAAKVSKTGGTASSFAWELTDSSWTLKANNATVLKATSAGIEVSGKIVATSGTIGGCEIVNGVLTIASANISSINADIITAGTLNVDRIASESLTGAKIAPKTITGGSSGHIAGSTITTNNTVSGINTNLGYGAAYGLATQSGTGTYPSSFTCGYLRVTSGISMNSAVYTPKETTIAGVTIHYLGY